MSLSNLLSKIADQGKDHSVASASGGDFEPAAAGLTGARLVGYYELGQHEEDYQGVKKKINKVQLVFELIGKKHPPKEVDGVKYPVRLSTDLAISTSDRAKFFQIFSRCRTDEKNFVQLIGKPFLLEVTHTKKKRGDKEVTYANINRDSIRKPVVQVPNGDGEIEDQPYEVAPAITDLKVFVWDFADAEMWDSIFIAGQYDERKDDKGAVTAPARSKNRIQLEIASALNFKSLPCYDYAASKLAGDGAVSREDAESLDNEIGDAERPARTAEDPDDPMKGVGS